MLATYDQFIGHYSNAIPHEVCDDLVDYIEWLGDKKLLFNRQSYTQFSTTLQDDLSSDVSLSPSMAKYSGQNLNMTKEQIFSLTETDITPNVIKNFLHPCLEHYLFKYDVIQEPITMIHHKVQKTVVGGGFHVWHYETSSEHNVNRVLAYIAYLNDVDEGGETEFLFQSKRVPPKKGDVVFFPTNFTHTHRGNPPLSNTKYIMTGWVEWA